MEIEQYACPNCNTSLKKSIFELKFSKKIQGNNVDLYEGVCKNCRKKFVFFIDRFYDKSVFWKKTDEKIFHELIENKKMCGSVKILYLTNIKKINQTWNKYKKILPMSTNIIVATNDFIDIINKYDLRKNHKIIFIERDILETRFEDDYPCILAEKNILEIVKNCKVFKLYSDKKTYFNIFEYLGE